MTMESGADAQQGADTAVSENENQQLTQAQIATLAQVRIQSIVYYTVHQMNLGNCNLSQESDIRNRTSMFYSVCDAG